MLQQFLLSLFILLILSSNSWSAILVMSPSGTYTTKATLAAAATAADAAGKTVVVTSPQTLTGNIAWPADRELKFEKGGYIISGSYALTGLKEARPEQFGLNTTPGTTDLTAALTKAGLASSNVVIDETIAVTSVTLGSVKLSGKGGIVQLAGGGDQHMLTVGSNSTIEGLTLTGAATTAGASYALIFTDGASNVHVRNCQMSGKQIGVWFDNTTDAVSKNLSVSDCTITYKLKGIFARGYISGVTYNYLSAVTIKNNDVRLESGFDPGSEEVRGIRFTHVDDSTIQGNIVLGAELSIEVWAQASGTPRVNKNVSVTGNIVDVWISFSGVINGRISNNTVDYSLRPTVKLNSPAYGVVTGIELITSSYTVVDSNTVQNMPINGIYTGYAASSSLTQYARSHDLIISNNSIYNCAGNSAGAAGMSLGGLYKSTITNNRVIDCGTAALGTGINVGGYLTSAGAGEYRLSYNLIFDSNVIKGTKNTDTTNNGAFRIVGSKDVSLTNNVIMDSAGHGLRMGDSACYNFKITGNRITNNAGTGFFFNGAGLKEITVENNDFSGNGATSSSLPHIYMLLRWNKGLVAANDANTKNTFTLGDLYNINHVTDKWIRATASGTMGTAPNGTNTMTTTSGSPIATVNNRAAVELFPGQYVSVAGAFTGARILTITPTFDSTGFSGATVVLSANAAGSVSNVAITYAAATVAQIL